MCDWHPRPAAGAPARRATSAVVGVVLIVALTAILAASVGVAVGLSGSPSAAAPQVAVTAQARAADGYPDGQVVSVTHRAGDSVAVTAVALVVTLERPDRQARLSGFPTRRLTAEHVAGADVFDGSYAGVDGAVDAASTDGRWESGEPIAVRIAQGEYDLERGEAVTIRVVHAPTNAVLAERRVVATG